jgi:hypothetical protein
MTTILATRLFPIVISVLELLTIIQTSAPTHAASSSTAAPRSTSQQLFKVTLAPLYSPFDPTGRAPRHLPPIVEDPMSNEVPHDPSTVFIQYALNVGD